MWVRVACLLIAIVIICFGSAFYMTSNLGVSTYDAVALIITNTWMIGKFQYIRIITDVICVIAGGAIFVLGGGEIRISQQLSALVLLSQPSLWDHLSPSLITNLQSHFLMARSLLKANSIQPTNL